MKKIIALLLAAAMCFCLLAACGEKEPEVKNVDLKAFYETIFTDPENSPAMMSLTDDMELLEGVYPGLKDIQTKQLVAYTPMMMQVAAEIILVEVADAKDVEAVKTILQTRIDNQVQGGAFYPATTEIWENKSEIVVNGNYVCLFALESKDAVVSSFNALFA